MPQLDVTTLAPQLIWLAITFVAFYLLMSRAALPRIATALEERQSRIARDLEEAERSKRETDEAIAAYEQALAEARGKAHEIAQANRARLDAEIAAERAKVDKEAAARAGEAELQITEAKAQALAGLGEVAADVAESIVKQLIGGRWTRKKITAAVGAALVD